MTAIRVELQLSDGSFTSGMLRAGQSLSGFRNELARVDPHFRKLTESGNGYIVSSKRMIDTNRTLLSTFRDVSIIAGGLALGFRALTGASSGFIGSIVKINADMERLRFQMEGMSNASDPIKEAGENVNYLRDMATKVPFSLKELSTTFVKLRTTGIDPMNKAMNALTDGIAAFGGTDEQFHRVTLGIQQMSGKSVIQMEEMRQQLSESMPNAMQVMARSMGVSISELTKAISTGRLQAKPALDAFYDELNRTYGGTAQRMMETFAGQVTQMHANLQQLATGSGLNNFVNETLKDLLKEFNAFLQTADARRLANNLGQAMSDIANRVGTAVKTLYHFRNEIALVVKAIGAVFAFKVAVGAIGSMSVAIVGLQSSLKGLTGAFGLASVAANTFTIRATSGATASLILRSGLSAAVIGVRALAGAMATFAPWLAAISIGVGFLATKFSWFKDKTKEAYEEMQKFGAETRSQAMAVSKAEEVRLEARIKAAQESIDSYSRMGANLFKGTFIKEIQQRDADAAALKAVLDERSDLIEDAGKREDALQKRTIDNRISVENRISHKVYSDRMVASQEWHEAELANMEKSGRTLLQINEEYQDKLREADVEQAKSQLVVLRTLLDQQKQAYAGASTDIERALSQSGIDYISDAIKTQIEAIMTAQTASRQLSFGANIENDATKIDKGGKALQGLLEDIAGLEAGMNGASDAYAEMAYKIARGDFGSVEDATIAVKEMHKELLAATAQKEALDKLMEGRKTFQNAVERARIASLEEEMDLREKAEGDTLDASEKVLVRLNAGFYAGLGPMENVRKSINTVIGTLDIQGDTLNRLSDTMQQDTFGDPTVNKINSVTEAVSGLGAALMGVSGGLGSLNFGAMANLNVSANVGALSGGEKSSMAQLIGMFEKEGLSKQAASGIVGNFKVESGFNTSIVGDNGTSFGLAQWHNERWTELKKFADSLGLSAANPMAQVKFTMAELQKNYPGLVDRMTMAASPAEAASMFMKEFERPHKDHANEKGRRQAAMDASAVVGVTPSAARYDSGYGRAQTVALEEQAAVVEARGRKDLAETAEREARNAAEKNRQAVEQFYKNLAAKTEAANLPTDELGANVKALMSQIAAGTYKGTAQPDLDKMIAAAKQLDDIEANSQKRKTALKNVEKDQKGMLADRLEIQRQLSDELARAKNPDYVAETSAMRTLNKQMDDYIENVRLAYGEGSQEFTAAQAEKAAALTQLKGLENAARVADRASDARDAEDKNLSSLQMARVAMNREMAVIDDLSAARRAAGEADVAVTAWAEAEKARIRGEYNREVNPMVGHMEQWGDLQGNLVAKSTQWADSMADGVTSLITSTGDLKGAIDGMLNDVVSMGVKYMFSGMGGDKAAGATGKKASNPAGNVFSKMATGGKMPFGIAHTGGIMGSSSLMQKNASPAIFKGAPKYHSGGVLGGALNALNPSEMPIIAKKHEGIFTPEQMSALAPVSSMSGQQFQISAPVTVNGSAGTPEQNDDLARKMARELESTMRGTVATEIQRQMRPGNMLNQRS